jgi:hypothetical protein
MGLADLTGAEGMVPQANRIANQVEELSELLGGAHFAGNVGGI